ncbi:MAG: nonstructural protein [Arizlama microvirus]|nr:MAG: nonstructural protein [Arizlama microvirus]
MYDAKTESYGVPFFRDFTANAIREWSEVASTKTDKQNQIAKFPADFTLFEIGSFEQTTGTLVMLDTKYSLGLASEHVKQELASQN